MSDPYMPLYVGDYLRDTGYLTLEQHGAYCLLLMRLWSAGGELPCEEVKLARICGVSVKKWRPIWGDLEVFFDVSNGALRHKRITSELQKAYRLREKRAAAGAKGGAAKSMKDNNPPQASAKAEPEQIRPDHTIELSSLRSDNNAPKDEFDEFWMVYPNKVAKRAAEKSFIAARKRVSQEVLMVGLMAYVNKRDDRPWCNPTTWLNQDRWEDRPAQQNKPASRKPAERYDPFKALAQEMQDEQNGRDSSSSGDWDDAEGVPILTIDYDGR